MIDHLVIAATSLDAGAAWIESRLGIVPDPGGAHPLMGTHNRLLSLGPDAYLEIIAIDPSAAPPLGPRWFGLDDFSGDPRLAAWVMRREGLTAPPGTQISAQQRGDLNWRIALPVDGQPMGGGALPMMIDWQGGPHPCQRLPDRGARLKRLDIGWSGSWPAWAACDDPRIVRSRAPEVPPLSAVIATPDRQVTL